MLDATFFENYNGPPDICGPLYVRARSNLQLAAIKSESGFFVRFDFAWFSLSENCGKSSFVPSRFSLYQCPRLCIVIKTSRNDTWQGFYLCCVKFARYYEPRVGWLVFSESSYWSLTLPRIAPSSKPSILWWKRGIFRDENPTYHYRDRKRISFSRNAILIKSISTSFLCYLQRIIIKLSRKTL